jgi:predicted acylesterase/phospholipase RssA
MADPENATSEDAARAELRLTVVVPGAVSLGAYEAGALTALLGLLREGSGRIVVDTIVGASAGSVTGALFAHALLSGAGDGDLEELWVDRTSIEDMLSARPAPGRPRSPLATTRLERWARSRLNGDDVPAHAEPIALVISLANLRGLRYRIAQPEARRAVPADTFRDARAFMVGPGADWEAVTEAAIASAANSFAFAPVQITRPRSEYPSSVEIDTDPVSFWFTDGGTVYNVPIGFALDAVFDPKQLGLPVRPLTGRRIFLLVNPHPTEPPARWPASGAPTFRMASARAFSLTTQQSLFDDLRRAEKTNSRVLARYQLQSALENLLPDDTRFAAAIEEMGRGAWERKSRTRALLDGGAGPASLEEELASRGVPSTPSGMLDFVLDEVTETRGKDAAGFELVSPDPGEGPVTGQLAGEKLLHFFGFFLREARASDFGLGYRNLRTWWSSFAPDAPFDVPAHPLEAAPPRGDLSMKDVPRLRRWWLASRLGIRYARELVRG